MRKTMLKTLKSACVITTVAGLATFVAQARDDQSKATSSTDYQSSTESSAGTSTGEHSAKSFIKQAFQDNQAEIDLANVGVSKAQNANLKQFCQMLQADHTKANEQLQPLALKYGVTEQPTRRTEREANKFEKENSGPEFDKNLTTELLKSHQKAIAKYERASSKLQETDVKEYADNMLPKLRQHLQKAASVAGEVGVDQATVSSIMNKAPAVGGTAETQESTTGTGTTGKTEQGAGAQQLQPQPNPNNKP